MKAATPPRSLLDLGPRARVLFVAGFLGLQVCAIAWGQRAPDHVLGFQMFNESSRMKIDLFREVERKGKVSLVPVPDGTWSAPDSRGEAHEFVWQHRIKHYTLRELGRERHANYGLDAQLFRLQGALDDMVRNIPEDARTKALVAVVEARRNGRPETHRLRAERP